MADDLLPVPNSLGSSLVNADFLKQCVFETEEHFLYRMPVPASAQPQPPDEIVAGKALGRPAMPASPNAR
ncbi:hypothetical protein ACU5P1_10820 [Pseudomonas plecoglossicida]|uniref:hypothetical protein n=1 Tax=Pseudomonas plecoglossicida TaxID=70775 RepID=UPI00118361C4|nr:hypothetical protein [Pseudomonas plecoglossicida]QLB55277.1 hypothetical protein HAV28_10745 [Pseudomonas plecoglossicida]